MRTTAPYSMSRKLSHEDDEDDQDDPGADGIDLDDRIKNVLVGLLSSPDGRDSEPPVLMLSGVMGSHHQDIIHQLLSFHYRPGFNEVLTLLINSPGGSVDIGWAIIDVMNFVRYPIHTVCIGQACSMAADVFVNGDFRTIGEHGTVMIHQHSSINGGSHSRLIAAAKGDEIEHERRLRHYTINSKYKDKQLVIEHLLETKGEDLYLTPRECIEHELADEIAYSDKEARRINTKRILGKSSSNTKPSGHGKRAKPKTSRRS